MLFGTIICKAFYTITPISLQVLTPPKLPAQTDGYNCGAFLLAFAKFCFNHCLKISLAQRVSKERERDIPSSGEKEKKSV